MKSFAAKAEEGVKGIDGKPSVGPVYRNLLSEKGFPPIDSEITTAWDIFRYINNFLVRYITFSVYIIIVINSLLSFFFSKSVEKFPDNNMLGWRRIVDEKVIFLSFLTVTNKMERKDLYKKKNVLIRIFVSTGLGRTIYVENVQGSIRRSFADRFCTTSRRS